MNKMDKIKNMSLKKTFLILFCAITVNSNGMNNDTSHYKVTSTRECIKYIERHGLTIHDDSQHQIKSTSGIIYILPNNEVVLIPTNFDLEYPGIIFKDLETFKYYSALDFFPIGEDNMTWFERYNNQIKQFRTHHDFYSKTLTETLHVTLPFRDEKDIKTAFIKVQSIIGSSNKKNYSFEQANLVCSFGLGVTSYLIDNKGYKLILREGYENYNPITEVLVKKNGEIKNVVNKCLIFFDNSIPDSLDTFMQSIGLPSN